MLHLAFSVSWALSAVHSGVPRLPRSLRQNAHRTRTRTGAASARQARAAHWPALRAERGARAQSEAHTPQEVGLYRSFAVLRSLLNPVPCTVEEASRFQQEDVIDIKKVRSSAARGAGRQAHARECARVGQALARAVSVRQQQAAARHAYERLTLFCG
jgi:hypothetical protein